MRGRAAGLETGVAVTRVTAATNAEALRPAAKVNDRESDGRGASGQPRRDQVASGRDRGPAGPDCVPSGGRRRRHREQGRQRRPAARQRSRRSSPSPAGRPTPTPCGSASNRSTPPSSGSGCSTTTPTLHRTRSRGCSRLLRPPRGRPPRPQAAGVALAQATARGGRHHLRHRSARDRARARRVRPGPARRRRATCSRSTPRGCWSGVGCSSELGGLDAKLPMFGNDLDFGWRAAAGRVPDGRGAPGRGLPRRGRPPWPAPYAADRAAHPLPGAPGRPLHAAGQRPRPAPAVAGGPPLLRHAAADARVPRGPLARRGLGRAGGTGLGLRRPRRDPAGPAGSPVRSGDSHDAAPLLAAWWVPYRHGLDFVGDFVSATSTRHRTSPTGAARPRTPSAPAPIRRPPVADDDEAPARTPVWWPASSPARSRWRSPSWCCCRCSAPARRSAR